MTALEAIREAWRRAGVDGTMIEKRIAQSNAALPEAKPALQSLVKEGHEEEFIQQLTKLFSKLEANPGLAKAAYQEAMQQIDTNNRKN